MLLGKKFQFLASILVIHSPFAVVKFYNLKSIISFNADSPLNWTTHFFLLQTAFSLVQSLPVEWNQIFPIFNIYLLFLNSIKISYSFNLEETPRQKTFNQFCMDILQWRWCMSEAKSITQIYTRTTFVIGHFQKTKAFVSIIWKMCAFTSPFLLTYDGMGKKEPKRNFDSFPNHIQPKQITFGLKTTGNGVAFCKWLAWFQYFWVETYWETIAENVRPRIFT